MQAATAQIEKLMQGKHDLETRMLSETKQLEEALRQAQTQLLQKQEEVGTSCTIHVSTRSLFAAGK